MNHSLKKITLLALSSLLLIGSYGVSAAEPMEMVNSKPDSNQIKVTHGYARATIPGMEISAAYMTIHNESKSNKELVAVSGDISKRIELHEHAMVNEMMKMRQVERITVAPQSKTLLKPFGLHIMLFNLTNGLKAGEQISLTLHFADGDKEEVTLPVQKIKPHGQHHH